MKKFRYTFSSEGSGRPYARDWEANGYRTKDNACVVLDGTKVVFAGETERFSKKKHDFAFPKEVLRALVSSPAFQDVELEDFNSHATVHNHHENHIYEVFYQSGFHDAAVLVNDGNGSLKDCVTLAYMCEGEKPLILKKLPSNNSPCNLYGYASKLLFGSDYAQGKLMGLASYGKNDGNIYIAFNDAQKLTKTDKALVRKNITSLFPYGVDYDGNVMKAKDIAYTVQKNFEDTLVALMKYFKELLEQENIKTKNFCMSGGGVLNCPTNSKIIDLGLFEHYYASPQPSDGCAESVGRAFRNMEKLGEKLQSHRLTSAYLGLTYTKKDIKKKRPEYLEKPLQQLGEYLEKGGIIAWHQGRAEYGPRALGHRSFLADPSKKGMLKALNRIKGREQWRPLAPIVPEELFTRIFEVENTDMCEFMLRTLKVKERWQPRLQAVCHIDGTTRPQLLKREINPQLYDLLMVYFEKTHIPCLVNTSLNINGFPIVETPEDLCLLQEEINYIDEIPSVKFVFVDKCDFYEVRGIWRGDKRAGY